jgi:hypothetical protein
VVRIESSELYLFTLRSRGCLTQYYIDKKIFPVKEYGQFGLSFGWKMLIDQNWLYVFGGANRFLTIDFTKYKAVNMPPLDELTGGDKISSISFHGNWVFLGYYSGGLTQFCLKRNKVFRNWGKVVEGKVTVIKVCGKMDL